MLEERRRTADRALRTAALLAADRHEVAARAPVEDAVGDRGGRHAGLAELALAQDLERRAGGDDVDRALLAGGVELAVAGDHRGGEAGLAVAEALAVALLARGEVEAGEDAGVAAEVELL